MHLTCAVQHETSQHRSDERFRRSSRVKDEVRAQLGMDLEMLIDGGVLANPQGSTMLDLTQKRPTIVREGPISRKALEQALGGNIQ